MTRISLFFVASVVGGVIALAPQQDTGASFQPAPVKTRSLSATGLKPAQFGVLQHETCVSSGKAACKTPLRGSEGPRG
ncbi:hypothetical protein [Rhizobium sp. C4]|uniref:hypothetical protein n=1 Tax=Rhizobium sp. C4 TaxID=1349800 RepID=UPI001E6446C6|nr:hypothetical protein [Rhizobium sp. C4]MCD2175385.1 hypothetical protein [Rhizobium sp. C4]